MVLSASSLPKGMQKLPKPCFLCGSLQAPPQSKKGALSCFSFISGSSDHILSNTNSTLGPSRSLLLTIGGIPATARTRYPIPPAILQQHEQEANFRVFFNKLCFVCTRYVRVCTAVGGWPCPCRCLYKPEFKAHVFLCHSPPSFLRQSLTLKLELTKVFRWAGRSEVRAHLSVCTSNTEIMGPGYHSQLLCGCWDLNSVLWLAEQALYLSLNSFPILPLWGFYNYF